MILYLVSSKFPRVIAKNNWINKYFPVIISIVKYIMEIHPTDLIAESTTPRMSSPIMTWKTTVYDSYIVSKLALGVKLGKII